MRVLCACEESQRVCIEFRNKGHEAYSCDIINCSGGHPEWHIKDDVLKIINGYCDFQTMDGQRHVINDTWDIVLAFPPCTDLAVSGAPSFEQKRKDGRQEKSILFFANVLNCNAKKLCVENPMGIISGLYLVQYFPEICKQYKLPKKYTQVIQPFYFGHKESKKTCLWLRNLPKLKKTNLVEPTVITFSNGKTDSLWHYNSLGLPKEERSKIRSKTFLGVAKAMAEQWG